MAVIAVTGASGFLGGWITEELVARGHEVRAVVRTPSRAEWLGVPIAQADLLDVDALAAAFEGVDAVVANAALTVKPGMTEADYVATNQQGTTNVLDATRRAGVQRLVHISTTAVYRSRVGTVLDEGAPVLEGDERFDWSFLIASSRYARTKARSEALVRESGLDWTCLRPGPIYGPRGGRLTAAYRRLLGWPVALAPTVRLPHVHAGDVAVAVAGALANPDSIGRAYNVTGRSLSPYAALKQLGHRAVLPLPVPLGIDYDDGAAERDLGFAPRPLRRADFAA